MDLSEIWYTEHATINTLATFCLFDEKLVNNDYLLGERRSPVNLSQESSVYLKFDGTVCIVGDWLPVLRAAGSILSQNIIFVWPTGCHFE